MHKPCWILIAALSLGASLVETPVSRGEDLRLNQVQVVGTHNSYHLRPPAKTLKAAISVRKDAASWDYSRQPLDEQLDAGVRSFELDLHLSKDGWQVMHVPLLDSGSTVASFRDALEVIRAWSDSHARHVPISLLLELKEEGFSVSRKYIRPQAADLELLDTQIRAVFDDERLLTPDDVRGQHKTLWEAVHAGDWPKLSEVAGQVFVILHESGSNRDAYLAGHPALEGRAMFVESDLGQPHSAVLIRNNPTDRNIERLAREGYLIRTRADSLGDLDESSRRQALASGAHILTTDYPRGEAPAEQAFGLHEGAPARVNPVTGPASDGATSTAGTTLAEPLP